MNYWTDHSNYDRISILTGAAIKCCKSCQVELDKEIDGLMYEVYKDGDYHMEGWEPKPDLEEQGYYTLHL